MARERKSFARKKGAACGGPPPSANLSDVCGTAGQPETAHDTDQKNVSTRSQLAPKVASGHGSDLARMHRSLMTVAKLLLNDPVYIPIFQRLEKEIAAEEESLRARSDILQRARDVVAHRERGSISACCISSEAPSPYRSRFKA